MKYHLAEWNFENRIDDNSTNFLNFAPYYEIKNTESIMHFPNTWVYHILMPDEDKESNPQVPYCGRKKK